MDGERDCETYLAGQGRATVQGESSRVSLKADILSEERFRLVSLSGNEKSSLSFLWDNCCFLLMVKLMHHWHHFIAAQGVAPM